MKLTKEGKYIVAYFKNIGKGLVVSVAILIVVPILLLAVIIIPLAAVVGQDVSNNITITGEA